MINSEQNQAVNQLDLNAEELQDLLGLIVHSYNNYLTGIMGHTELAQLEDCDNRHQFAFEQVLESSNGAVALGKDLLAVIGRSLLSIQSFSMLNLLQQIQQTVLEPSLLKQSLLKQSGLKQDIQIELKSADDYNINTDGGYFVEVIIELLKFIQALSNRQSSLSSRLSNKNLDAELKPICIELNSDHSLLISAPWLELDNEQQKRLFQPFYSSRELMDSKAVGLAKAKGFFKQTGATIQWQNNLGFILRFESV